MKYFFTIICAAALILFAQGFLVSSAQAQLEEPPGGVEIPDGPAKGSDLVDIVDRVTNWIFIILLLSATVFIIIAAFQFLSGGGNPNDTSEARRKLLFGVIAIVVGSFAKAIPIVLRSIVG